MSDRERKYKYYDGREGTVHLIMAVDASYLHKDSLRTNGQGLNNVCAITAMLHGYIDLYLTMK